MSARKFQALEAAHPGLKLHVLENIARDLSMRLRNLNGLIRALAA